METAQTAASKRRHSLYVEIGELYARLAVEQFEIDEETAAAAGLLFIDQVRAMFKGQNIYFPSNDEYTASQRDWEIFDRMGRGNANEIAAEYGLSYVRVHQIYRRCLDEKRRLVQRDRAALSTRTVPAAAPTRDAASAETPASIATGERRQVAAPSPDAVERLPAKQHPWRKTYDLDHVVQRHRAEDQSTGNENGGGLPNPKLDRFP